MEKWYLFMAWGSCFRGDRNGAVEEFDNETAANNRIHNLLNDYPDASWTLVYGVERSRRVQISG